MASPGASPAASSTAAAVSLAQAVTNLSQQPSFVMTVTMTGVTGATAMFPNAGNTIQVTTTHSGGDAHVVVATPDGTKLAEIWRVGGQQWVSLNGGAPQAMTGTTAAIAALSPFVNAPSVLFQGLSAPVGQYSVTGQQTVNGVQATVEKGAFQASSPAISAIVPAASGTVDSTIWVANQGGYLVRAQLLVGGAAASPTTGATGTPSTAAGASIIADVTNVGSAPTIATPTP